MIKYRLAPYVRMGFQNEVLYLGFGSIQEKIEDKSIHKAILEAAYNWRSAKTPREIKDGLLDTKIEPGIAEKVVNKFLKGRYLIEDGIYENQKRFSRQLLYFNLSGAAPQRAQDSIQNKHVVIIGCGGIGNFVSISLASAGIGELTLIDNDEVELSNLTRQIMFTEADVGEPKTEMLAMKLYERASHTKINKINKSIRDINDFFLLNSLSSPIDLIVLSGDQHNITVSTNRYCVRNRVPFVNIGYIEDIAVWGPFVIPGKTGCFECQSHFVDNKNIQDFEMLDQIAEINTAYQAPSIGPVNSLASSLALIDILRFLGGFGEVQSLNKRVGLWTHSLKFEIQNYSKNKTCKICGRL